MSELTKEQVDTLKVAFSLFDKNGDGCISLDELKQAFAELGQHPSDDEIAQMIAESDSDGNGSIDFSEFLKMMSAKIAAGN